MRVNRLRIAKHRKRRSDIIIEDSIPDLSTLFMMLGKLKAQVINPMGREGFFLW